jgi:hypothetical protein
MEGTGEGIRPTGCGIGRRNAQLIPKPFLTAGQVGRQPGPPRLGQAGTGVIDEDPPNRPSGREEVSAAVELPIPEQLQVGFVNEGGGIEGAVEGFGRHLRGGELPQFDMDEQEQLRGTLTASFPNGFDRTSDIRQFKRVYKSQDRPSRDDRDAALRSD